MRDEIIEKLQAVNQEFYNEFAQSFAQSRALSEPGLDKIIQLIKPGECVLDLGCGHGRIAQLLPEGVSYTGMDFSAQMLAEAAKVMNNRVQKTFVIGNLTHDKWPEIVTDTTYNWIFLRAVLHHIPSYASRRRLVARTAQLLSLDGKLILANWQFLNVKRLVKRLIPWDHIYMDASDIEPGDYLLDWKRDGYGIRYVHLIDEEETRKLAVDAGLSLQEMYLADGHTNDLTLYACLTR